MATGRKYPQKLFWFDAETTGLPADSTTTPKGADQMIDFTDVHIMEVGVIVTDFALNPEAGYTEVVKLNQSMVDVLKRTKFVADMHKESGLLLDSRSATMTIQDVEQEIIKLLKDTGLEPQEFQIAGSGVAAFDLNLIRTKMPELAKWLVYYPFDVGVLRRTLRVLIGKDIVNPTPKSYQDGKKTHRAMDDVKAHLEEAGKYRDVLGPAFS